MASVADVMTGRHGSETLDAALSALPARQGLAVVMRHVEGFSNPEIAEMMGKHRRGGGGSLTARGRRALKSALYGRRKGLGFEDDGRQP